MVSIIFFLPEIERKVFHYLRKALNKNIRRSHYFNIWSNLQEKKFFGRGKDQGDVKWISNGLC